MRIAALALTLATISTSAQAAGTQRTIYPGSFCQSDDFAPYGNTYGAVRDSDGLNRVTCPILNHTQDTFNLIEVNVMDWDKSTAVKCRLEFLDVNSTHLQSDAGLIWASAWKSTVVGTKTAEKTTHAFTWVKPGVGIDDATVQVVCYTNGNTFVRSYETIQEAP